MNTTTATVTTLPTPLTNRDRAVLRAVAAGRCEMAAVGGSLMVDGLCCCDQFAGTRLSTAGLIACAGHGSRTVTLTASGAALLEVA
ncbi:hypothetical protein EV193_107269 [Herbihabitans rhizosphaerae]|uniref:Uncharacterized protein n=1 Tax=Herbihabitans rhizosphaerae TaxID=1872711 RepID=A0A4Q7KJ44_9PSEU|nr:hypothetical protein [Herbihabitans rhizosphaerae]RZS36588.1 hypothetical protein EV193_107269 [Herbihabitans rhizosphaerae]